MPELSGFLGTPDVRELRRMAEAGPLVYVNVSAFRSDALVLRPDRVRAVPLPLVGPEEVRQRVLALPDLPGSDEGRVRDLLDWLWRAIADPVLDALDLTGDAAGNRLWWVPTGMLTFLPLHAAQPASSGNGLLDRVTCSYVPTLRALAHARKRPAGDRSGTVVVGPGTAGGPPLPASRRETQFLRDLLGDQVEVLSEPGRSSVLEALATAGSAHFACHAESDPVLPSRSALLVHDGDGRMLTVADLVRLRLTSADLAYLSACGTARTSPGLSDEVLHITSAFQLAGFRHVVGTLWPVPDSLALRAAKSFYRALADGVPPPAALHAATLRMRERFPDSPSVWAGHVHVGA